MIAGKRKERVVQQLVVVRSFVQQPLMVVLGVLAGAGAAKSGHGTWALGGILTLLLIYFGFGAAVTSMAVFKKN
jgi:hypothetical protein